MRRTLDAVAAKRPDMHGEPRELSVDRYLDPARCQAEQAMLREFPIAVGFASQVAAPGAVLTHDLSGAPVLVTRDDEGTLRAFLNVCRHRGTRLEDAPCGQRKALVCPYHAWTYDLAGRLRGVPHRQGFPDLDLEARGLVPLAVGEYAGLVFVLPTPGRAPWSLQRFFAPLGDDLAAFADHVLYAPSTRPRALNWKLMLDGSWETYHFRPTHAQTIYPLFIDNVGVFDWAEPHLRMVLPKRSITALAQAPEETWRLRDHANVLYGLFPNTIVLCQPDHAMVVTAWPTSPTTSTLAAGMLIPEAPRTDRARAHWDRNEEIFWTAIEEDLQMGESIQRGLASGANASILCGRYEHLIPRYHAAIDRALRGELRQAHGYRDMS